MLKELFERLAAPSSEEDFASAMAEVCSSVGLDHYVAVRLSGVHLEQIVQLMHNSPQQSAPLIKHMNHWTLARLLDRMRTPGAPILFGDGEEPGTDVSGFRCGVAISVHELRGVSVLIFARDASAVPAAEVMKVMKTITQASNSATRGLQQLHAMACPLSARELECLHLFVEQDMTSKEMANALAISKRTAEHHLESARKKFGVESTLAAALHAINQGWIVPPKALNSGT